VIAVQKTIHQCIGARKCLAAMLVASALLVNAAQPTRADARPLATGITYVGDSEPLTYQQAKRTGAQMVRVLVRWAEVAPKSEPRSWQPEDPGDPNYDWAPIDLEMIHASEAGLISVVMVHGAPSWAQRCQAPLPGSICDPDPTALAAFATAAARRYSGYFGGLPRVRY
jgi:hypothetical protein